jgi:hypothetical protein
MRNMMLPSFEQYEEMLEWIKLIATAIDCLHDPDYYSKQEYINQVKEIARLAEVRLLQINSGEIP